MLRDIRLSVVLNLEVIILGLTGSQPISVLWAFLEIMMATPHSFAQMCLWIETFFFQVIDVAHVAVSFGSSLLFLLCILTIGYALLSRVV